MKKIIIILLSLILIASCTTYEYEPAKVEEFEKYCIEWDGWIQRDNMIWNCYDFVGDISIKCGYEFLENAQLEVIRLKEPIKLTDMENLTEQIEDYIEGREIYNCSKWIKAWGDNDGSST